MPKILAVLNSFKILNLAIIIQFIVNAFYIAFIENINSTQ